MTLLVDVAARISAEPALFRAIEKVATLAAATESARGVPQSPTAFVLPLADQAAPPRDMTQVHDQALSVSFGVLIAVRGAGDHGGGRAADDVEALKDALRLRLVGWVPSSAEAPVELLRGRLVDIRDGVAWWLEEYRTQQSLRVQIQE